ncbi:hypothetical protein F5Y19DRAFT_470308 [Xylariaceae sp. FL1651]|nr:hypothetical protein F5Y19DRAFT_470308 [Xylariaceae sp. FL1651]
MLVLVLSPVLFLGAWCVVLCPSASHKCFHPASSPAQYTLSNSEPAVVALQGFVLSDTGNGKWGSLEHDVCAGFLQRSAYRAQHRSHIVCKTSPVSTTAAPNCSEMRDPVAAQQNDGQWQVVHARLPGIPRWTMSELAVSYAYKKHSCATCPGGIGPPLYGARNLGTSPAALFDRKYQVWGTDRAPVQSLPSTWKQAKNCGLAHSGSVWVRLPVEMTSRGAGADDAVVKKVDARHSIASLHDTDCGKPAEECLAIVLVMCTYIQEYDVQFEASFIIMEDPLSQSRASGSAPDCSDRSMNNHLVLRLHLQVKNGSFYNMDNIRSQTSAIFCCESSADLEDLAARYMDYMATRDNNLLYLANYTENRGVCTVVTRHPKMIDNHRSSVPSIESRIALEGAPPLMHAF